MVRAVRRVAVNPALLALLALTGSCLQQDRPFRNAIVLYEGEPYGDLIVLAEHVRQCMHSDKQTLPRVVLAERIFDCYTSAGWKQVYGCTSKDFIVIVAPVAEQSQGELWSHELTHYFGAQAEDDPCGVLTLDGFSLQRPDAGH